VAAFAAWLTDTAGSVLASRRGPLDGANAPATGGGIGFAGAFRAGLRGVTLGWFLVMPALVAVRLGWLARRAVWVWGGKGAR
jgi:hypothetical protein